jgi:hypothetical protein
VVTLVVDASFEELRAWDAINVIEINGYVHKPNIYSIKTTVGDSMLDFNSEAIMVGCGAWVYSIDVNRGIVRSNERSYTSGGG